jgi:hypothetical protein
VNSSKEGVVVPITDGTPGTVHVVAGTYQLSGVACSSATSCEAVGWKSSKESQAVVVTITNGTPW